MNTMKLQRWTVGVMLSVASLAAQASATPLRIGLAAEPTSMDPHYQTLTPNLALHAHIYEPLVAQDEKQALKPALAESWKVLPDGITWEFKLRANVKWHDGSAFTADDVVFTFERVPNVQGAPAPFTYAIRGKTITKVDDLTVRISTGAPSPLTPNDLSVVFITSKTAASGQATPAFNTGAAAIGTGPYKFAAFVPGDKIQVTRNDAYWGGAQPWTTVEFRPIKVGTARVAALLAGDVDLIEDVPPNDINRLSAEAKITLARVASHRSIFLQLDQDRETTPQITAKGGATLPNPLKDKRVREALSLAINRDAIVSRTMDGNAVAAGQFLPDGYFGRSPNLQPPAFDPERAKQLLAEAGLPNGFKATLHAPTGRYVNDARIAEAIAQMWTRIGIDATFEAIPVATYFGRALSGGPDKTPEFSITMWGSSVASGDVSSVLKPLMMTFNRDKGSGTVNAARHANPAFDALIDRALATIDLETRRRLYVEATELITRDAAYIPLHYQINVWAARKGLAVTPRTDEMTMAMSIRALP
jgi:peptide/nickel transport system substrate-binding protein